MPLPSPLVEMQFRSGGFHHGKEIKLIFVSQEERGDDVTQNSEFDKNSSRTRRECLCSLRNDDDVELYWCCFISGLSGENMDDLPTFDMEYNILLML